MKLLFFLGACVSAAMLRPPQVDRVRSCEDVADYRKFAKLQVQKEGYQPGVWWPLVDGRIAVCVQGVKSTCVVGKLRFLSMLAKDLI